MSTIYARSMTGLADDPWQEIETGRLRNRDSRTGRPYLGDVHRPHIQGDE